MRLSADTGFVRGPSLAALDPDTYRQLMMSIIDGEGDLVAGGGGFRQIGVPVIDPNAQHPRCLVVFAVYTRYGVVVLTNYYPVDALGFILIPVDDPDMPAAMELRKKFTTAQQIRLAERKKLLDAAMKRRFG